MTRCALAALLLAALLAPASARAGSWDATAAAATELRFFPESPRFPGQRDVTWSPSLSIQPDIAYEWNGGSDRLSLVAFLRWDGDDDNRSHGDLREAHWLHRGDELDVTVGFAKVFWGVTESRHLVDIVNQSDAVEDLDGEDKLGQPMIAAGLLRDWGTLELFVLPYFRERTFPDDDARLHGPLPILDDGATYDSAAEENHVDVAARFSHTVGEVDFALSYFHGTSREPRLIPVLTAAGGLALRPHYDQIDQAGLDLQLTHEAWLWKFEGLGRTGHGDAFLAAVGGFEYTLYQVFETGADLGLLMEYQFDGRDEERAPATIADNDLFGGFRLALNNEQDTALLASTIVDLETAEVAFTLEAERRIGSGWKAEVEARFFTNTDPASPLAFVRDDGLVTFRLTRYF